ncbi:MAG: DUF6488 family protein [Pseudomonadota bacterium]
MKTIVTTLVLSSLLFGAPVMAGGGHDHGHSHAQAPVNKGTAEKSAAMAVASLIAGGKIDKSWSSTTANSSEKKDFNGRTEWVVTFVNDKVTDPAKQKLYVFMSLSGEYIAANYTGN